MGATCVTTGALLTGILVARLDVTTRGFGGGTRRDFAGRGFGRRGYGLDRFGLRAADGDGHAHFDQTFGGAFGAILGVIFFELVGRAPHRGVGATLGSALDGGGRKLFNHAQFIRVEQFVVNPAEDIGPAFARDTSPGICPTRKAACAWRLWRRWAWIGRGARGCRSAKTLVQACTPLSLAGAATAGAASIGTAPKIGRAAKTGLETRKRAARERRARERRATGVNRGVFILRKGKRKPFFRGAAKVNCGKFD